ncbi:MAG: DUF2752 domain-containing protein [Desulfobacteraceae bacterium]|jgi:hypothetical protein
MRLLPNTAASPRPGWPESGRLRSWVGWRRPRSYWEVVVYHLPLTFVTGIALLLPHVTPLDRLPLIPCTFLHLTGWPCPFCGFTRSFWALATGQWGFALTNCPLALGVFLCVVLLFLWNAAAMIFGVVLQRGPRLRIAPHNRRKATAAVFLLFLLNWFFRLAMGLA